MTVWNEQGPLLGRKPQSGEPPHFFPVAMYVHNRLHYFQHTLRNLKKAQGVSQLPLLIISMDSVNAEMLKLAENVAFAPLRILFHPPRVDLMRPQSIIAIKEHWLWLQDMIWGGGVREIAGTDGHVALLEEDHAVTPDYLRYGYFFRAPAWHADHGPYHIWTIPCNCERATAASIHHWRVFGLRTADDDDDADDAELCLERVARRQVCLTRLLPAG